MSELARISPASPVGHPDLLHTEQDDRPSASLARPQLQQTHLVVHVLLYDRHTTNFALNQQLCLTNISRITQGSVHVEYLRDCRGLGSEPVLHLLLGRTGLRFCVGGPGVLLAVDDIPDTLIRPSGTELDLPLWVSPLPLQTGVLPLWAGVMGTSSLVSSVSLR